MHRRHWLLVGSVVLLTAFFGVALTQGPPGEESVCDVLQGGTPGLYGLCLGYCGAQDCEVDFSLENPFEKCRPASKKILERYNAKRQPGDPFMPCVVQAECPCFTQAEIESIPPQDVSGQYSQCDAMPPITNIIGSFSPLNAAQIDESATVCIFALADEDILRNPALTAEEAVACRDLIVSAILASPFCPL